MRVFNYNVSYFQCVVQIINLKGGSETSVCFPLRQIVCFQENRAACLVILSKFALKVEAEM